MSCEIKKVLIDIMAINKIQKHGQKEIEKGLNGQLCGIYNKEKQTIEITNCFALPDKVLDQELETKEQQIQLQEQNKKTQMQYEEFMIKQFEQMKLDTSYVGWYQVGNFSEALLSESFWIQYKYQKNIPFAVYLVADPTQVHQAFRAYRLNRRVFRLLNLSKKNESVQSISMERLQQAGVKDSLFEEVPLEIQINPVQQQFMSQFHTQLTNGLPNFKFDLNEQFVRSTRNMIEGLEELDQHQLAVNDQVLKKKEGDGQINSYDINGYVDVLTSISKITTLLSHSEQQQNFINQAKQTLI